MAAVSQASYGRATPSSGTTSLKRKRRKEKGFTRQPERARGKERASGAWRASAKAKEEEKESSAQDAFLTDRGMLRTCVSADRAGGGKNGAVTARGGEGGL